MRRAVWVAGFAALAACSGQSTVRRESPAAQSDAGSSASGAQGGSGASAEAAGKAGTPTGPQKLPLGVCPSPVAWSPGVERCGDDSFIHVEEALGCALPERDPDALPAGAGEENLEVAPECNRDDDCGRDGYCVRDLVEADVVHRCITPCRSDSDCDAGYACVCDRYVHNVDHATIALGRCLRASCSSDADCASGAFCISPLNPATGCGWGTRRPADLACQREAGVCSGPEECPGIVGADVYPVCIPGEGSAFVCYVDGEC